MSNLAFRSDLDYFSTAISLCDGDVKDRDGNWYQAPYMASLPYSDDGISQLIALSKSLRTELPELLRYGVERAKKAYTLNRHSVTKPSYSLRLENFDGLGLNQLETLHREIDLTPRSGGLAFSVFHPSDLVHKRRPGYVPCLISGVVTLFKDSVQLNVMFRSQSIIEFGLFDIVYLRLLQSDFVEMFKASPRIDCVPVPGELNIHCARIFLKRRLARVGNSQYLYRKDVLPVWNKCIEKSRFARPSINSLASLESVLL